MLRQNPVIREFVTRGLPAVLTTAPNEARTGRRLIPLSQAPAAHPVSNLLHVGAYTPGKASNRV